MSIFISLSQADGLESSPGQPGPLWLPLGSLLYLLLPTIIFLAGWLKPIYGFPVIALLGWASLGFWQQELQLTTGRASFRWKALVWLAVLALAWCILAGIGGLLPQSPDYLRHNAIFKELTNQVWPIYFGNTTENPINGFGNTGLNYHFAWYLPPALLAKIIDIQWLEFFALLWSWIGVFLVLCWIGLLNRGYWLIGVSCFILFGGAEMGMFIFHLFQQGSLQQHWFTLVHQGWEQASSQQALAYLGHTPMLNNSPQTAIGTWLAVAMLWQQMVTRKKFTFALLIIVSALLWSPIAAIVLLVLSLFFMDWTEWKQLLRPEALIPTFALGAIGISFYAAHVPIQIVELSWIPMGLATFAWQYPLFLVLEFAVIGLLIYPYFSGIMRKQFWVVFGLLAVLPVLKTAHTADFVVQASTAPLWLMAVFVARFIAGKGYATWPVWRKSLLALWLALVALTAMRYWLMAAAVPLMLPQVSANTRVEDAPNLAEADLPPATVRQYLGKTNTFFYRKLAVVPNE